MKTYFAVSGVVKHDGKVLIMKKSSDDYHYPDRWSFCSGYVKEFQSAEDNILREIKEETGLTASIVKKREILCKEDKKIGRTWVIMPFLCKVSSKNVKLDHENTDFKWISHNEIKKYPTVPGIEKTLKILGLI